MSRKARDAQYAATTKKLNFSMIQVPRELKAAIKSFTTKNVAMHHIIKEGFVLWLANQPAIPQGSNSSSES